MSPVKTFMILSDWSRFSLIKSKLMVLSSSKSILYGSLESPSGKQREGFKSGYRIRVSTTGNDILIWQTVLKSVLDTVLLTDLKFKHNKSLLNQRIKVIKLYFKKFNFLGSKCSETDAIWKPYIFVKLFLGETSRRFHAESQFRTWIIENAIITCQSLHIHVISGWNAWSIPNWIKIYGP